MPSERNYDIVCARNFILSMKDKWSPALQIRTVLLSIQALLSAPNPDDPLDTGIAKHWIDDLAGANKEGAYRRLKCL